MKTIKNLIRTIDSNISFCDFEVLEKEVKIRAYYKLYTQAEYFDFLGDLYDQFLDQWLDVRNDLSLRERTLKILHTMLYLLKFLFARKENNLIYRIDIPECSINEIPLETMKQIQRICSQQYNFIKRLEHYIRDTEGLTSHFKFIGNKLEIIEWLYMFKVTGRIVHVDGEMDDKTFIELAIKSLNNEVPKTVSNLINRLKERKNKTVYLDKLKAEYIQIMNELTKKMDK